ncbi:MAG: serine/threonine protein kinase [Trizodia sp. TS-e1964]|nr:MAG: serine/threonine protein kinase [Trizodia sp. TS-e1964]
MSSLEIASRRNVEDAPNAANAAARADLLGVRLANSSDPLVTSHVDENTPPIKDAHSKTSLPAVRFSSVNQEIEPDSNLQSTSTLSSNETPVLSPAAEDELRNLSLSLQTSQLQKQRMSHFAFEPVSLPASRAASTNSSLRSPTPDILKLGAPSPRYTLPESTMHTPPLTPAATRSRDAKSSGSDPALATLIRAPHDTPAITPQTSIPPPTSISQTFVTEGNHTGGLDSPKPPSPGLPAQATAVLSSSGGISPLPKHIPHFSIGPAGDSIPPSRDQSPSESNTSTPGTVTPYGGNRFQPPTGDRDDPYSRSKRPPQPRNLDAIDPRFIFSGKEARRGIVPPPGLSKISISRPESKGPEEKRHSHIFGGRREHSTLLRSDEAVAGVKHGSMSDLKRFFRGGYRQKSASSSPTRSAISISSRSGIKTPPRTPSQPNVPFADDHGLQSKYGKFGKVLGAGAGGSVRLMRRSTDGVTFAVKQFRDRHPYETEREYTKKVTAEFCIGSTLHHGNVIETLDIVQEKGKWYEVMEYAPYDLFAVVMTGKMSKEETLCSFLQILHGVTYLHSMGLAHRDLKLDNVVVNNHGIMKLIDFGSATVFKYPFESGTVLASGIVGSDPYLAPEVYDNSKYDPQPTDIWSLAIIYCCMSLRRFPWKMPRISDNSFKLFASAPSPTERRSSDHHLHKSTGDLPSASKESLKDTALSEPASQQSPSSHHHHHHHHRPQSQPQADTGATSEETPVTQTKSETSASPITTQIKGPWRLLRVLPRESRNIISKMLELDPKRRATLEDVLSDPWISGTVPCRQEEGGRVILAPGHSHTLEPPNTTDATSPIV